MPHRSFPSTTGRVTGISATGTVMWSPQSGCVTDITIREHEWCWKFEERERGVWLNKEDCGSSAAFTSGSNFSNITLDRVIIKPNDVLYGGAAYVQYIYEEWPEQ